MPEYLRALVVILFLSVTVLGIGRSPACAVAMPEANYRWRASLWLGITLVAFLAKDFWLFIILTAVMLLAAGRRDPNPMALFFFLVFAVPDLGREISGLGLAHQLFTLNYPRLLALTVLLPAALSLLLNPSPETAGLRWPDRILTGYIILTLVLQLTVDSFTNTMRYGLYYFMDIGLPYYVASRSLKNLEHFRDTLMSFAVAAMILAAIGAFEFFKSWLLYSSLDNLLDTDWAYGGYLLRGESLRALATTGQPIALGFVMAVACGLFLFLRRSVPNQTMWFLGLGLLLVGLLAPVSRGPWLGAAAGFLAFVASGPKPLENLSKLMVLGLIAAPIVLVSPLGDTIIEHLPFVGTIETDTVIYRQQLLQMSLDIIRQNPIFGSFDFLMYLEDLRQGQGIIDIVNTYLGVALASGLVGLALFVSFFAIILIRLYKTMQARPGLDDELRLLGRTLFATLAGIMVIIFTVSSITVIPIVYWSAAGLGLAYIRLLERQVALGTERISVPSPRIASLKV